MSLTSLDRAQTVTNAALAGSLAALIAWFGPPGHGLRRARLPAPPLPPARLRALDELLVRGPLQFVGYSLLYYPLAALVGIRCSRCSASPPRPPRSRSSPRQTWGRLDDLGHPVLRGRRRRVGGLRRVPVRPRARVRADRARRARAARPRRSSPSLVALTFAASPLAFLFLLVVLAGVAASRSPARHREAGAAIAAVVCAVGAARSGGSSRTAAVYPFSTAELLAALTLLRPRRSR